MALLVWLIRPRRARAAAPVDREELEAAEDEVRGGGTGFPDGPPPDDDDDWGPGAAPHPPR